MKRFRMKAYLLFTLFLGIFILPGCGGDAGNGHWDQPIVNPSVLSTSPAPAALGVPIGNNLTVTFNGEMDPATLASPATSFTVKEFVSNSPVNGVVTASGNTATFNPDADLLPLTEYTGTITTGAMNLAGQALASDYVWRFTTGATVDTSAPFVSATSITNGAPDQLLNIDITATFNEAMDPATLASPANSFTVSEFVSNNPVSGVVTYLGNTATFNPDADLLPLTEYIATVSEDAKDLAGLALTVGPIANPWRWRTGAVADIVAPWITITSPVNGAIEIPVDSSIEATFNEEMSQATMLADNFTVVETLSTNPVLGMVAYDPLTNVATFTPSATLTPGIEYTVTVTDGAEDLASNSLVVPAVDGLPVPNHWTFTTAALVVTIIPGAACPVDASPTIPTVTMSDPTSGNQFATTSTMGVANNGKLITATFSLEMDPTTINDATFTLTPQGGAVLIPASVTYDALTKVATLTTSSALSENTFYDVIITTDVTSAATPGVPIACPYEWTFKTVSPPATGLAPINPGMLASYGIASAGGLTNSGATTINGDVVLNPNFFCNDEPVGQANDFGLCGGTPPINNAGDLVITQTYPDTTTADKVRAALLVKWGNISPAQTPGATVLGCGTIGTTGGAGEGIGCNANATLPPGAYISAANSTIVVSGQFTLDGMGNPDAVFIFQAPSALTMAVNSQIVLIGEAKASNVWWYVGSDATLNGGTISQGNILASSAISMGTLATSCGRLLSGAEGAGAFTFLSNTVSVPGHPFAPTGCE